MKKLISLLAIGTIGGILSSCNSGGGSASQVQDFQVAKYNVPMCVTGTISQNMNGSNLNTKINLVNNCDSTQDLSSTYVKFASSLNQAITLKSANGQYQINLSKSGSNYVGAVKSVEKTTTIDSHSTISFTGDTPVSASTSLDNSSNILLVLDKEDLLANSLTSQPMGLILSEANNTPFNNTLGNIPIGEFGLKEFILTNNTNSLLTLSNLNRLPTMLSYYARSTTCKPGLMLKSKASCTITIQFLPDTQGINSNVLYYVNALNKSTSIVGSNIVNLNYYSRTYAYFSQLSSSAESSTVKECIIGAGGIINPQTCSDQLNSSDKVAYSIATQTFGTNHNVIYAIPSIYGQNSGPLQKCNITNYDNGQFSCTADYLNTGSPLSGLGFVGTAYSVIIHHISSYISPLVNYTPPSPASPLNLGNVYDCTIINGTISYSNCAIKSTVEGTGGIFVYNSLSFVFSGVSNQSSLKQCDSTFNNCKTLQYKGSDISGVMSLAINYHVSSNKFYINIVQAQNYNGTNILTCEYNPASGPKMSTCQPASFQGGVNPGMVQKIFSYGTLDFIYTNQAVYSCSKGPSSSLNSCAKLNVLPSSGYNFVDMTILQKQNS